MHDYNLDDMSRNIYTIINKWKRTASLTGKVPFSTTRLYMKNNDALVSDGTSK